MQQCQNTNGTEELSFFVIPKLILAFNFQLIKRVYALIFFHKLCSCFLDHITNLNKMSPTAPKQIDIKGQKMINMPKMKASSKVLLVTALLFAAELLNTLLLKALVLNKPLLETLRRWSILQFFGDHGRK